MGEWVSERERPNMKGIVMYEKILSYSKLPNKNGRDDREKKELHSHTYIVYGIENQQKQRKALMKTMHTYT